MRFILENKFVVIFVVVGLIASLFFFVKEPLRPTQHTQNFMLSNNQYAMLIEKLDPANQDPAIPMIDDKELHCMAKNIWHEARGTDKADRLAVAHVTKNRVMNPRFPNTVCAVVQQGKHKINPKTGKLYPLKNRCQFSWYCDGRSDKILLSDHQGRPIKKNIHLWAEINELAYDVLIGYTIDPTNGSTHYFAPKMMDHVPHWAESFQLVHTTTGHNFYRM